MVDKEIPLIKAEKRSAKDVNLDPAGFFVIEIDNDKSEIRVEYYTNVVKKERIVSGSLQIVFIGRSADELCETIVLHIKDLMADHYMYLGRELQRAECAIKNKRKYVQGGC